MILLSVRCLGLNFRTVGVRQKAHAFSPWIMGKAGKTKDLAYVMRFHSGPRILQNGGGRCTSDTRHLGRLNGTPKPTAPGPAPATCRRMSSNGDVQIAGVGGSGGQRRQGLKYFEELSLKMLVMNLSASTEF